MNMKTFLIAIISIYSLNCYAQNDNSTNWIADLNTGCKVNNPQPQDGETIEYVGGCISGVANGSGKVIWYLQNKFFQLTVGNFIDGYLNGKATLSWSNGERFIGEFVKNKRDGYGIYFNSDGSIAKQGIWKNNKIVQSEDSKAQSNVSKIINGDEIKRQKCISLGLAPNSADFQQCMK